MLLLIDNYDSFAYNLVQYLGELGAEIKVFRNDKITVSEIEELKPSHVVISPGPCTPTEAGISMEIVSGLGGKVPILGVCLGHQAIAQALGGKVVRGKAPVHGKTAEVHHDGKTIYEGIENPFVATRYHSLVVDRETLPNSLEVSAETSDGIVMGIRHKNKPIEGVQFHPESILTSEGKKILKNFLRGGKRSD